MTKKLHQAKVSGTFQRKDSMQYFTPGLLTCSVCDSDLVLRGKCGAVLRTECPSCGLSSDSFQDVLTANMDDNKTRVEVYHLHNEPREVEVYHLRK